MVVRAPTHTAYGKFTANPMRRREIFPPDARGFLAQNRPPRRGRSALNRRARGPWKGLACRAKHPWRGSRVSTTAPSFDISSRQHKRGDKGDSIRRHCSSKISRELGAAMKHGDELGEQSNPRSFDTNEAFPNGNAVASFTCRELRVSRQIKAPDEDCLVGKITGDAEIDALSIGIIGHKNESKVIEFTLFAASKDRLTKFQEEIRFGKYEEKWDQYFGYLASQVSLGFIDGIGFFVSAWLPEDLFNEIFSLVESDKIAQITFSARFRNLRSNSIYEPTSFNKLAIECDKNGRPELALGLMQGIFEISGKKSYNEGEKNQNILQKEYLGSINAHIPILVKGIYWIFFSLLLIFFLNLFQEFYH